MNKKILLGDVANEKKIPSRKLVKVYQADNGITYRPITNVIGCDNVVTDVSVYEYPIAQNMIIRDPEIIKHLHESGEETVYEFDGDKVTSDIIKPGTIWSHKNRLYVSDGEGLFPVNASNMVLDEDEDEYMYMSTLSEMRQDIKNFIQKSVSSIRYNSCETVTGDKVLMEECNYDNMLQRNQTILILDSGIHYNQENTTKMVNLLKDKILVVPENHHVGLMLSNNEDHMFRFDERIGLLILTFHVYSRENENNEWYDTGHEIFKPITHSKQNLINELNELFKFNGIDIKCSNLIDTNAYELAWSFETSTTLSFISKAGEPPRLYLTINVAKSNSERNVKEFKTYDLENNKWETYTDLSKLADWVVYRTCYKNAIGQNMNVIGGYIY